MTEYDSLPREGECQRPLLRVLGDAAYCNACGAQRGEPCRLGTRVGFLAGEATIIAARPVPEAPGSDPR